MKNTFFLSLFFFTITTTVWSASFSYSGSRPVGSKRSLIDTAWVGKNVDIVRNDSCFILNLNGEKYVLYKQLFSRLVDKNTWMEGFGIKDRVYTLFFGIDNGKSILKNFSIREIKTDGITHLFRAEDDPIQWDYVPTIVVNSTEFYQKNKHTLLPKITCQSMFPGQHVDLNVKIIAPGGEVLRNASSPKGYTFTASVVTSDKALKISDRTLAWDDQSGIMFGDGRYKIEIYDGKELLKSSTMVLGGPATTSSIVVKSQPVFEICPDCGGRGRIIIDDSGRTGNCSTCGGTGKIYTGEYKTVIE